MPLLALSGLCFYDWTCPVAVHGQVIEKLEKVQPGEHDGHGEHHHLQLPLGEAKCEPEFTYGLDALGPTHWGGLCAIGKMQAPVDITGAQVLPVDKLKIAYHPSPLDVVNDCNQYRIVVKFPANYWLTVGKKPYNLSQLHFLEPGENAFKGKRPRMSVQFVHFSPEGVFLIIEVPVVAGAENPVVKTLWKNIPAPGKENKVEGVTINPADLLPVDHAFYRFPGSLTTPLCNEVVTWYLMKNPIELSEDQIQEYTRHYHNSARPIQPLNGRPVIEGQ
jgi:carbonic anhydrase